MAYSCTPLFAGVYGDVIARKTAAKSAGGMGVEGLDTAFYWNSVFILDYGRVYDWDMLYIELMTLLAGFIRSGYKEYKNWLN